MKELKYLFWVGTVVIALLGVFLLVSTNQKLNTATTTNTVTFSGEGKVIAKPDIAVVSFSIVTEAATSKAAQDANSPQSKAVTDFLNQQGVEEKDIKTTRYNIYPTYSFNSRPCPLGVDASYPCGGKSTISGYQLTQSFEVKIRNLDKASVIVDGLVTAGANNIGQLDFTIDEPEKLQDEARAKAIADAKAKAKTLEKQIGIRLGKIINFSENTGGYPIYYLKAQALPENSGGDTGPSLPSGENEITVNVTLTYQIK